MHLAESFSYVWSKQPEGSPLRILRPKRKAFVGIQIKAWLRYLSVQMAPV